MDVPKRELGLLTATTIIVGAMIGSGILILPADMLKELPSPPLVLLVFAVAAVLTVLGALTVAELSSMHPKAGGQYVYLKEAFGSFPAYLFGWANFWVIQTGTVAAVAAAFSSIFVRFVPLPGQATPLILGSWRTGLTLPPWGQAFLAIGVIGLLTLINNRGVKFGGLISNLSTFAKAAGLVLVVAIVLLFGKAAEGAFSPAAPLHADGVPFTGGEAFAGFASALILILFAYDGWYMATYVAAEMKDPRRNLPLALVLGAVATTVIYLSVAGASLYAVNLEDATHLASGQYLAGLAAERAGGPLAASLVTVLALVSIFGTTNAYVLTAPRIAYAQARDGLFLRSMARLHPTHGTPNYGSLLCGLWASLLVMTGLYDQLVFSVVFPVFIFHVLTAAAWFRLRRTRADAERPFRTPFGRIVAGLFLLTSLFVVVAAVVIPTYRAQALLVLGIIAVGAPVYLVQRRRQPVEPSLESET